MGNRSKARQLAGIRRKRIDPGLYGLIIPAVASLGLWYYFPVIQSFVMSFFDWDGFLTANFLGLDNYAALMTDGVFWTSIGNMFFVLCFSLTVPFLVPFVTAELIAALRSRRAREFFRAALVLPVVVPSVVLILMWRQIYEPTHGLLNEIIRTLAGRPDFAVDWLNEPNLALAALLFIKFPFVSNTALLIYSAAIEDIPTEIYDAARLEGLSFWQRMRFIDIPYCIPQFRFLIVTGFSAIIADYTSVLLLTQGKPLNRTMLPGYYLYQLSTGNQRYGYASAIALLLIILILVITFFVRKYVRSDMEHRAK
jgi:raffinose/stachyose/melibiose transport system permease protein